MNKPIIEVSKLSKVYRLGEIGATSLREEMNTFIRRLSGKKEQRPTGDFWALNNVSFKIKPGEVVGIIGQNGAGKSTLLKVISRITDPSYGQIHLKGRVAALLEVGTGFHPELTGRENIYLNGTILGMRKREIDQKLDEIIDFSGIEKHIDTPVKRYSSGMNVRLGFAVAAHLEPEILIIDEVLAVGDANFQKKCLGKMQNVASQGRTVLFVSHNMPMIQNLCTRCILIDKGEVDTDGETGTVVRKYLDIGKTELKDTRDLSSYPRASEHRAIVNSLKINESFQIDSENIPMGESIKIDLTFRDTEIIKDIGIRVRIENEQGIPLAALNSYYEQKAAKDTSGGTVQFKFSSVNLIPGKYFVSVSISESRNRQLDYVERCNSFEIIPASNIISSGYKLSSHHGLIYIPAEVTITSDN